MTSVSQIRILSHMELEVVLVLNSTIFEREREITEKIYIKPMTLG